MNPRHAIQLALLAAAVTAPGCSKPAAPPTPPSAAAADHSESTGPRLNVVERHGKRICESGIEHRHVTAVYSGPLSEDAVMSEARKMYESLRQEIHQSCPTAEFKRIWLLIYTDEREAGTGRPMVMLQGENTGTEPIPEWPPKQLTKKIRDESTRPAPAAMNLYFDWLKRTRRAEQQAEKEIANPADATAFETAYKRHTAATLDSLYRDWNISPEEFKLTWWHVNLWIEGMKSTPELAQRMAAEDDSDF